MNATGARAEDGLQASPAGSRAGAASLWGQL